MKNAWIVSFIRIPLLFASLLLLYLLLDMMGIEAAFPFLPDLSTIYFTLVNIICFFLLYRIVKKEGKSLKELIGFRREYLVKDIFQGVVWLFVLFIPFVLAVIGSMFLMYGNEFIHQFEAVFAGDIENISRPRGLLWFAGFVSFLFPFLNAPIEELMYRGYAQTEFIRTYRKVWVGVLIPSIGFSLQHLTLAASLPGAIVFAAAFFVWGIGSGIIYHKQQRLLPLIICHFLVNISFSILPLTFLALGVY